MVYSPPSPPSGKCVKKFWKHHVKKEKLFDTDRKDGASVEFFSFSGDSEILAIFMSAAAFFASFFWL